MFGVYSYINFLILGMPKWALPLSYLWAAAIPFMGNEAMRFAWVLPAALLGQMIYSQFITREEETFPSQQ
jgi:hypothetical protein